MSDAKLPPAVPLGVRGLKMLRRVAIAVVGGTVLLIGVALIVLPGPAILVIPLGLAILALEFAWAREWLQKFPRPIFVGQEGGGRPARRAAQAVRDHGLQLATGVAWHSRRR